MRCRIAGFLLALIAPLVWAQPVLQFELPAQPLAESLRAVAKQTSTNVMFDRKLVGARMAPAVKVQGTLGDVLGKLLAGTGIRHEFVNEKTVTLAREDQKSSGVSPAEQMRVASAGQGRLPAPAEKEKDSQQMVVEGQRDGLRPVAGGNLDLPRSENDPLPYQVFTQEDLRRKGTVDLAEFLRQEIVDLDVSTVLPNENYVGNSGNYWGTATDFNLRGFGADHTVMLVNGRRLPPTQYGTSTGSANLNAIPVSMIERIEVLPASASAIYGGNALGGVINIVLRPHAEFTQLSFTYDNTTAGFDAPKQSYALTHGRTLQGGALDLRFSANYSRIVPATEAELGYLRASDERKWAVNPPALNASVYGATPNIRSANGSGLFGPGTSSVTSVAPGADGLGGIAAFSGREGVRNPAFFEHPAGPSSYSRSLGLQYGQARERNAYTAGVTYRPVNRLELAANFALTVERNYGGSSILLTQQTVAANAPHNPFGQAVIVNLLEYAPKLGAGYDMGRSQSGSASVGALLKMGAGWDLALDYQHSRSQLKRRAFFWDSGRIPALVASGAYNPFRDSLATGLPDVFYERVLTFDNGVGGFQRMAPVVVDEYSARLVNAALPLPTGTGVLVVGANYLETQIKAVTNVSLYGDGSILSESTLGPTYARTRNDWGVYGELQLPLLPERWLPGWLKRVEADIAYRYSGSDTYKKSPNPPTVALRFDLAGGLSLRAAHTVAFRPPSSAQSIDLVENRQPTEPTIRDPRRGNEQYTIRYLSSPNPDLLTEKGVTRTVGLIFQRGATHQIRASLDYVDTDKTNELTSFSTTTALTNEQWYPERVQREAPAAGDPYGVGRVTFIRGGPINVLGRRSKNWNASLNYAWNGVFGGVWDLRGRAFGFDSYRTQLLPTAPVVENIENPDASLTFLKYRGTVGSGWSRGSFSAGLDGRYYHSRMLSRGSWASQGSQRIDRYWEFDAYAQYDLSKLIPWQVASELRGQLRINNVFDARFPFHVGGTGDVAMYGDWRGQTYSLSLTATF